MDEGAHRARIQGLARCGRRFVAGAFGARGQAGRRGFRFPSSLRRPPIHEELGKVGRMITALTRRSEEWGTAYRRYVEHHGAELAIGPKLANLARRLAPASGGGGVQPAPGGADVAPLPENWAAIVEAYTRDVPGWREALRPGALDALDAGMIPAARLAWAAVQGLHAPAERVQRAAELQGALDQLEGSDARTSRTSC